MIITHVNSVSLLNTASVSIKPVFTETVRHISAGQILRRCVLNSALCHCTAQLTRPSIRPRLNAKYYPLAVVPICHTSRPFFVFRILNFYFFTILFSFQLTWAHMGGESVKRHLSHYTTDSVPKSCMLLGKASTKLVKINFNNFRFIYFFLPFAFSLSLIWDHMEVNISNDISSESTHRIHSTKFIYYNVLL